MKAISLLGGALTLVLVGCASADTIPGNTNPPPAVVVGEPCVSDPGACAEDDTCWVDAERDGYRCHTAGLGEEGDLCNNIAGKPTCAHGLSCYAVDGFDAVCTPFCDGEGKCAGDAPCQTITIEGIDESIRVCQPPAR